MRMTWFALRLMWATTGVFPTFIPSTVTLARLGLLVTVTSCVVPWMMLAQPNEVAIIAAQRIIFIVVSIPGWLLELAERHIVNIRSQGPVKRSGGVGGLSTPLVPVTRLLTAGLG